MLLVVNAPKAFQRKLVDGVDRSTTRQVKTNQLARQPSASFSTRADPMRRDRWRSLRPSSLRGTSKPE
jgi:hypothetical protein